MALSFDPNIGIEVDDYSTVRSKIRYDFQSAFSDSSTSEVLNVDPETPAGQLIDSATALVCEKDSDILFLANQFNPEIAEGLWQDALGKIYFLERKRAEATVVDCLCTGLYGTLIPKGSMVQSTSGYQLKSLNDATIGANGTVNVEFVVTETGPIPISAESVTKILTVISGWDSVNNPAAGSLGRNEETRAEFETRRYNSVAKNAQGSVASIQANIMALDGVLDCVVLENSTNETEVFSGVSVDPHSVAISVYGGEDADIAAAIYAKKSAGCGTTGNTTVYHSDPVSKVRNTYKILRPTATAVKIRVRLKYSTDIPNDVADKIQKALVEDFSGRDDHNRVGMAQTLYASRFYALTVTAGGVADLLGIELSWDGSEWGSSLVINGDIEPTLEADDVSVILEE